MGDHVTTMLFAFVSLLVSDTVGVQYSAGGQWVQTYVYHSPNLHVTSLSPNCGPLTGGTEVRIQGSGIRDFGRLMKCKFGETIVPATLRTLPGESFSPFNSDVIICAAPPSRNATTVSVEITLTGETYSSDGIQFTYYNAPTIDVISPSSGSTRGGVPITVTGSGFRGNQASASMISNIQCAFTSVVNETGARQVPTKAIVPASLLGNTSDTVLECMLPEVRFLGPVRLSVTLNGQDFGPDDALFTYKDNWHIPLVSGQPAAPRMFHTMTYSPTIPKRIFVFGGFSGQFRQDLQVLYLDVMSDFYPSATALDMTWADSSDPILTPGDRPQPRAQHSATWVNGYLYIYGGVNSFEKAPLSSMNRLDTNAMHWEIVRSNSSLQPAGRALHTASGVGSRIFVFGGRVMEECGYGASRPCLVSKNDMFSFDTETFEWTGVEVPVSLGGQMPVKPLPRHSHAAVAVDELVWVFGGAVTTASGIERISNDLFTFDTRTGLWEEIFVDNALDAVPVARKGHVAVQLQDRFIAVFGGYGTTGHLNDLWILDTWTRKWSLKQFEGTPTAQLGHAAVVVSPFHVMFFGGMSVAGKLLNELHQLNPLDDTY